MKIENLSKFLLPIGLFFLSATIAVTHFTKVPDFAGGLLKGVAIGLIVVAVSQKFRRVC